MATETSETHAPVAQDKDVAPRLPLAASTKLGLLGAASLAVGVSTRSGLGLSLVVVTLIVLTSLALRSHTSSARWVLTTLAFTPMLIVRDNTWLAISILCTTVLVLTIAGIASATRQPLSDLSLSAVLRRTTPKSVEQRAEQSPIERNAFALFRGLLFSVPIVGVFWALLAASDEVFAQVADPSVLPFARSTIFFLALPFLYLFFRFGGRARSAEPRTLGRSIGSLEASVVLASVSALFSLFIALRVATIGRDFSDELVLRSEVRSGFFQLLWVAVLTVVLVLAVRAIAGSPTLEPRLGRLALLTIGLAAVIDGLALGRIASYVEQSFLSPLRFWSFGFGLWLFVVLALTAARVAGVRANSAWFTVALVSSWMAFVFVMGAVNPDERIATHNFDHPPTGEEEYIAVNPLIWLSEDATTTIVENIEALRPLPNDRYERMVAHLCTRDFGTGWREFHFSRRSAEEAVEDLC